MLNTERLKLINRTNEYLSIGITENGKPLDVIPIPWEKTAHAHNMKLPDVYIAPDDINDESILKTLHGYRVIGCYIFARLDNYDFLSAFTELRDLYIRRAASLTDLEPLRSLSECGMLYLEGARLDNLDVICDLKKSVKGIFAPVRCLGLFDCEIQNIESLREVSFSELVVGRPKKKNERERWCEIPAQSFEYYEI